MQENNIITLEDLRLYFEGVFNSENIEHPMEEISKLSKKYNLTDEEFNYIFPYTISNEEQSNQHTLNNTKKASEIIDKYKAEKIILKDKQNVG